MDNSTAHANTDCFIYSLYSQKLALLLWPRRGHYRRLSIVVLDDQPDLNAAHFHRQRERDRMAAGRPLEHARFSGISASSNVQLLSDSGLLDVGRRQGLSQRGGVGDERR